MGSIIFRIFFTLFCLSFSYAAFGSNIPSDSRPRLVFGSQQDQAGASKLLSEVQIDQTRSQALHALAGISLRTRYILLKGSTSDDPIISYERQLYLRTMKSIRNYRAKDPVDMATYAKLAGNRYLNRLQAKYKLESGQTFVNQ